MAQTPAPGSSGHPARLRVGVVGTGRVGAVLGAALQRAGHLVTAGYGKSSESRQRAHTLLPHMPLVGVEQVLASADLVLFAVPDDVLPELVAGLARADAFRTGQLVVHVSGRHGIDVLAPAVSAGVLPLAIHPVMTFGGTADDLERLSNCRFGVTAPDQLWPAAQALVVEMGGEPVRIAEEHRGLYHAALAHASNHLVTLVAEAIDLLRQAGVEEPSRMLEPLLASTLDNALRRGDLALTGPVSRGDAATVAAHLAEIDRASSASVAAYLALARRTAYRVIASGRLSAAAAEPLLEVLAHPAVGDRT